MTISDIEKKFDIKFPYIDGNGEMGELDDVKEFLRTEITALLDSMRGKFVSENWGERF